MAPVHGASSALETEVRAFRALHEIAMAMAGVLEQHELARLVTRRVCSLLEAEGAILHVWDEEEQLLRLLDADGADGGWGPDPLRLGEGLAGRVALQRSVLLVGDYARWPEAVPIAIGRGVGSALAAPLLVGERLIGVLTAYFGQPAVPGDAHAELLSLAAAQVAPALESVKLHAVQTRLLERERALREVTRALASDLDEAQVVQLAVSHAARLLEAPYARVWLVEDEAHLRCAAAKGFTYPGLIGERLPVESLVGLGLCQENINLADAPAHPAWRDPTFARRTGLRGYLAVPIRRAGDSLGVLIVMRPQTRFFRGADEQLLRGLADAVAVAVANARALAAVAASEQRLRSTYEAIAPLPAHRLVDWCRAWRWRNDEPARAA